MRESNDAKTATSNIHDKKSSRILIRDLNASADELAWDKLSLDGNDISSIDWEGQEPLVKFGVDMTSLSDVFDNIIRTVN